MALYSKHFGDPGPSKLADVLVHFVRFAKKRAGVCNPARDRKPRFLLAHGDDFLSRCLAIPLGLFEGLAQIRFHHDRND